MINTTTNTEVLTNAEIHNTIQLQRVGAGIIRYSLVLILLWIGMFKFTSYEAEGIKPLVENSPLLSWAYSAFSIRGFARLLGVIEIILGILIAGWRASPKVSAIGSFGAIIMFLITLSFILTTPGIWQPGYGFPFLSSMGQSRLKDLVLLGAATFTAGESLTAANLLSPHVHKKVYTTRD